GCHASGSARSTRPLRMRDIPQEPQSQAHWLAHRARLLLQADRSEQALEATREALAWIDDWDNALKEALEALASVLEAQER
ncbi:MAG: hypothetical protein AAFS10_23135, partial [Myxococcota bacterium]